MDQVTPQQAKIFEDRAALSRIFATSDGRRLAEILQGTLNRVSYHWSGLQPHHHVAMYEGQRIYARTLLELGGLLPPEGDFVNDPRKSIPQFTPESFGQRADPTSGEPTASRARRSAARSR